MLTRIFRTCTASLFLPVVAATSIQGQAQADRIPAQLSNQEFNRLIAEISEEGGTFLSENFVSNEGKFQRIVPELKMSVRSGGVYLGVGPEQNFSYIAALKPRLAFIVDIRRQNLVQHLMYKALFELSPTRAEFLSRLYSRPAPVLPSDASIADIMDHFDRTAQSQQLLQRNAADVRELLVNRKGVALSTADSASLVHVHQMFASQGASIAYDSPRGPNAPSRYPTMLQTMTTPDDAGVNQSFLGSEASYRVVREMHLANLIVPVVGNFSGPKALRGVGAYLQSIGAKASAFYVSNVEQYLFQESGAAQRFYASVATIPLDSTALFIRPPIGATVVAPVAPAGAMSAADSVRIQIDPTGQTQILRSPRGTYIILDAGAVGRVAPASPSARVEVQQGPFSNIAATIQAMRDGQLSRYNDIFRIPK